MKGVGTNLDSVRRHNLGMIVDLVHHRGPTSRSELTKATGLNRSTVAALVAELVTRGVMVESEPTGGRSVGRPSPVVSGGERAVAFAANPELDAITVGAVGLSGRVIARVRRDVDHVPSVDEAVETIAGLVAELAAGVPDSGGAGIGLAIPGLVRASDGVVRLAPHLDWVDEPIVERIEAATGRAAYAGNDASLGARAERTFGVGRGIDDLVYLNGGASGIGGGIIAGGRPIGGVGGYAGEFGHTFGTDSGEALEDVVDRAGLMRVAGLAAGDDAMLEAALAAALAGTPGTGPAAAEVERQVRTLGRALAGTVNILNPERVVLGGFLGILLELAPEALREALSDRAMAPVAGDVEIVRAELGQDLLMIGAAELVFDRLIADPAAGD